jgi:hypothetical protein
MDYRQKQGKYGRQLGVELSKIHLD